MEGQSPEQTPKDPFKIIKTVIRVIAGTPKAVKGVPGAVKEAHESGALSQASSTSPVFGRPELPPTPEPLIPAKPKNAA